MKATVFKFTKVIGLVFSFFLFVSGTYNAFFINSSSFMAQTSVKFVKRLDELDGRIVAAQAPAKKWFKLYSEPVVTKKEVKKLEKAKMLAAKGKHSRANRIIKKQAKKINKRLANNIAKKNVPQAKPVINNDLSLQMTELYNAKKYKNLKQGDYSGELYASGGVIDSLSVALPDGNEIQISYAEMNGNVFNYEYEGQTYAGMMYEVSKGTYMVTMTNGPHSGTRMKFVSDAVDYPADNYAQNDAQPGNAQDDYDTEYGNNYDVEPANDELQAANDVQEGKEKEFGFNFENNG